MMQYLCLGPQYFCKIGIYKSLYYNKLAKQQLLLTFNALKLKYQPDNFMANYVKYGLPLKLAQLFEDIFMLRSFCQQPNAISG